ncbi:flagellar biosynthetic protein FliR [Thermocrinis minervae]|uniref:Flagellar biosynthetic protein FliR n=1 Tax=Thermocrinis minervae TaxID=381751 RepID=A0A1M6PZX8_9AQUI|nr:flagellar biosynthetic protein FliR [Thermocrinis minervae]SHK13514.1 flagellar biosynthetic protein FliR [Thermocrinis minervae]
MILDLNTLLTLFLVYLRVFAFLIFVPVFGTGFLPNTVKAFLGSAIGLSLFFYQRVEPIKFDTTVEFFIYCFNEFLLGFVAGLLLRFVLDAVFMAGELMSVNMGLGLATLFLPQQPQTTILGLYFSLMATIIFINIGGLHIVYLALLKSLQSVPPGSFKLYSLDGHAILKLFYASFSLALKVAIPLVLSMLIFNITLAVINRLIPQMNVFIVGLPFQLFLGFLVLLIALPVIVMVITSHMKEYIINFTRFLGG